MLNIKTANPYEVIRTQTELINQLKKREESQKLQLRIYERKVLGQYESSKDSKREWYIKTLDIIKLFFLKLIYRLS